MSSWLIKDFAPLFAPVLLVVGLGATSAFGQQAPKSSASKQVKEPTQIAVVIYRGGNDNNPVKNPNNELRDQAKKYSKGAKGVGVFMVFREENMKVAQNWKERTEKYFAAIGIDCMVYIGKVHGGESALFYINEEAFLVAKIPFGKEDTLEKVRDQQRSAADRYRTELSFP